MSESNYRIHRMELGPMENFIYLIEDTASKTAAVVDPAWEPDEIIRQAKRLGIRISAILLTHSHHDHINGIQAVLKEYDAPVHLLKAETALWSGHGENARLQHGGDEIAVGDTRIKILHTPGHTPGSACYHVGNDLIAGDTLFVFGCGRCDLAGGDPEQMFHTLNRIKTELPRETVLHPGHHYAVKETSTLAEQVDGNPFLHFDDKQAFVHYRMHEHDKVRSSPYGPVPKA